MRCMFWMIKVTRGLQYKTAPPEVYPSLSLKNDIPVLNSRDLHSSASFGQIILLVAAFWFCLKMSCSTYNQNPRFSGLASLFLIPLKKLFKYAQKSALLN